MNKDNFIKIENCFRDASIDDGLCSASILKYADSVKNFFSVIGDIKLEDLKDDDFKDYVLLARKKGASNSRIANVLSAMKWILARLQQSGVVFSRLEINNIRKPKIGRREVNYLTDSEITDFIGAIECDFSKGPDIRKIRFMALAMFLLQTGARIGEVLSINIEDIDRVNMEIQIIGKGKKPRTLFLIERTLKLLDLYLIARSDKNEALFVALNGKSRWRQTDVGRSFRRYKKLSAIKKRFTIHTLRHTFATRHLLNNTPINTVQFFLGHSNLETTMKYYIGAVEKSQARQFIKDEYFDFMPNQKS